MQRFEGKRVIITGGANGIGKATVARFASEGAAIVLTDLNGSAAEVAARQIAARDWGDHLSPRRGCVGQGR